MFCPLAVDYGNAADWVAGIGTLAAVGMALYIANGQERFARHTRLEAKNEEYGRRAHLIGEVVRLTGEIEAKLLAAQGQLGEGGGFTTLWHSGIEEIDPLRLQLYSLQQLAKSDPQVFGEIGRIARECEFEKNILKSSPDYVGFQIRKMKENLSQRRSVLSSL